MLQYILFIKKRIPVIGSQRVDKETLLETDLPAHWPINIVRVPPFRFEERFGPFTMLLAEGSSQTGFFRHLSNRVFRSAEVQKYITYEDHIFFENL